MEIRHAINGGLAECCDEEAEKLIGSGQWVVVKAAAAAPRKATAAAKVHAEASSKLEG
jgi:hypothetical protein